MSDGDERERERDRKRQQSQPSRRWYASRAWKHRRAVQLRRVPWCEPCKAMGKSRPATVANHNPPHREDRTAFFHGPLESCCSDCHDGMVQQAEGRGFRASIDRDGWPTDPAHPFNRERRFTKAEVCAMFDVNPNDVEDAR